MLNSDPHFKAGFPFNNIFLLLFILDNILLYIEKFYFYTCIIKLANVKLLCHHIIFLT